MHAENNPPNKGARTSGKRVTDRTYGHLPAPLRTVLNNAPKAAFQSNNLATKSAPNVEKFFIDVTADGCGATTTDPPVASSELGRALVEAVTSEINGQHGSVISDYSAAISAVLYAGYSVTRHGNRWVLSAHYDYSSTSSSVFTTTFMKTIPSNLTTASNIPFTITPVEDTLVQVDSFLMSYPTDVGHMRGSAAKYFFNCVDQKAKIFSLTEVKKKDGYSYCVITASYNAQALPPASVTHLTAHQKKVPEYDHFRLYPITSKGSWCKYCRSKDHTRKNCTLAPSCNRCGSTGHPVSKCATRSAPKPRFPAPPRQPTFEFEPRSTPGSESDQFITVQGRKRARFTEPAPPNNPLNVTNLPLFQSGRNSFELLNPNPPNDTPQIPGLSDLGSNNSDSDPSPPNDTPQPASSALCSDNSDYDPSSPGSDPEIHSDPDVIITEPQGTSLDDMIIIQ